MDVYVDHCVLLEWQLNGFYISADKVNILSFQIIAQVNEGHHFDNKKNVASSGSQNFQLPL